MHRYEKGEKIYVKDKCKCGREKLAMSKRCYVCTHTKSYGLSSHKESRMKVIEKR